MDPLLISLVSACTALFASVVGPFVTLTVAKRQFNATVLSANRQKWIESLRDLLAEFTSQMVSLLVMKRGTGEPWESALKSAAADPQGVLMRRIERVILIQWKIRLMTNTAEADHRELCQAIDTLLEKMRTPEFLEAETRAALEHITRLSQAILKREWERVKRGI